MQLLHSNKGLPKKIAEAYNISITHTGISYSENIIVASSSSQNLALNLSTIGFAKIHAMYKNNNSRNNAKISISTGAMPRNISIPILSGDNSMVLTGISLMLNSGMLNSSTDVSIASAVQNVPTPPAPAYYYFLINSSISDANISAANYTFSVNSSWISSMHITPEQVTLYKYTSNGWTALPTVLVAGNSTAYKYAASSNSFSTYVVSFTANGISGDTTPESITLPAGYKLYLCGAGANYTFSTSGTKYTWTQDVGADNNASIGHQSSNVCSAYTTGASNPGLALAGIGVNAIYYSVYSAEKLGSTSASLSYTVSTSNSFVVLIGTAGYYNFTTITIPSTCTKQVRVDNIDTYETAYVATCQNAASGSYTFSASLNNSGSSALAAYVFPSQNVILDDNPTTGTIATNGNTYTTGQTMQVIGTNAITANPPANFAFSSWSASNANIIISGNTNPATMTVEGSGTVTANYNGISKFVESGLPVSTQTLWNALYDGILNSSTTETIVFSTPPGNELFSIPAQKLASSGIQYVPNQSSGYLVSGNTTYISFSKKSVTVLISHPQARNKIDTSNGVGTVQLSMENSTLTEATINFAQAISGFNISILNQTTPPSGVGSLANAFRYIAISENLAGSTNSIDPYVQNVTYAFSVPVSAVIGNGLSDGNVDLYKYEGSTWVPLNTMLAGSNATAYFYQAVSNSLSSYAVGFTTGSTSGGPTSSTSLSLTLATGYPSYFWAGAFAQTLGTSPASLGSVSWTSDSNLTEAYTGAPPKDRYVNQSFIGNSISNTGTISASGTTTSYATIAGIGANVIFANGAYYQSNTASTSDSFTFTPSAANSFAIIAYASGGTTISSITAPTGCNQQQAVSDVHVTSEIYTCNSLPATLQTAAASTTTTASIAIVAYVFPPYSVTLDDSPNTGTITTGGTTYSSGSIISVIGTNAITANPSANLVFSSWSASNANIIISGNTNPATMTVEGTGTVTANYNSLSCTISLSPTTLSFGSINPESNVPTNKAITDDNTGNANAYMLVYGGNWVSGSNSFGVSNTLWDAASQTAYTGSILTATPSNTLITVPASGSNSIYFGLGVPGATPQGAYSQNIIIENSC